MAGGMIFEVQDSGTPKLVGMRLKQSGESTRRLKPVMENIFTDMKYVTLQVIESSGRRGGGSWANLAPATVVRKGSGEILYTRGAMAGYSSIGNDALVRSVTEGDGTRFQIKRVTNDRVSLGTSRPYASLHQSGGQARGRIPARPFFKFTQHDVDRWNGWIVNKLTESLRVK